MRYQVVVDFLVANKCGHVFDLAGGMITYLEDAISRKKGIECIPMHHEQAAGFAAEGYARKSQNFGVAIATSGPGATNLITPIASCYFDSVPVMFITGQVHTNNLKKNNKVRQDGFQETDIVGMVKGVTKYAVLVKNQDNILYELEKSLYLMTHGRKGPVLLDIPINIQRTEIQIENLKHFYGSKEHVEMEKKNALHLKTIEQSKVEKFEILLREAKAPVVLIGNGIRVSGTDKELFSFIKKNNLPVVSSLLGLDSYPHSGNFVGYIGSNGNRHANIVLANADLIIAFGTRLDVRQTGGNQDLFNSRAKIVHVDIDKSSINYNIKSDLNFETDLKNFFEAVKFIESKPKKQWELFVKNVTKTFSRNVDYKARTIDPHTFLQELAYHSGARTTISVDVGQHQMWTAQSFVIKKGQRCLFSGGMGSMGFSLPAAIGAWYADKKNDIFVISGDGGFQMNMQEMETIIRNNIPIKLFVFNNKSLGMVREFQDLYFNKNYQSTVLGYGNPDFKKISAAYGFEYFIFKSVSKDDKKIKEIINCKKPVFIEIDIDMMTPLTPKVVFGHALDDQYPYLEKEKREYLNSLKEGLYKEK